VDKRINTRLSGGSIVEKLSFYRGVGGFEPPVSVKLEVTASSSRAWPKEFGGDTVGRLGMCAHTPKRNKNNAHGVTPIYNEMRSRRRLKFEAINTGS
jgi:hypothetical protein